MKNKSSGKSGIYAIKNLINNKMYIGSTSNFKLRCRSHKTLLKRGIHFNSHLQNAVNKYGLDNFEFITLKEISILENQTNQDFCDTLNKEEQNFITQYNTVNLKYGYNIRKDCSTNLGIKWNDASKKKLSNAKKGKPLPIETQQALKTYLKSVKGKPRQCAKDYWKNLSVEAKKQHKNKIMQNLQKAHEKLEQNKKETGSQFSKKGQLSYKQKRGKVCYLYSLTGEFISEFITMSDLLAYLNLNKKSQAIINLCIDKYICHNFFIMSSKFDYLNYELRLKMLNDSNNRTQFRRIMQCDHNYECIKIWNNLTELAAYLGYKKSTPIRDAALNNKLLKGYYFKYLEPYTCECIGKPEELLENPLNEDNQQPSTPLTKCEGSETNN